ncbi:hypothetical protein [Halomonas daqiaonensis]|nr:hypothetical protein [Halomonas daqiaonensis]
MSSVALDLGTVSGLMASSAFSDDVVGIGVLTVTFSLAFDGAIESGR